MLRSFLSILAGLIVATVVILVIQMIGHQVWPPPADVHSGNEEARKAAIDSLPLGAFLSVMAAWGLGTLAGAFAAGWLAPHSPAAHAWLVGIIELLLAITMLFTLPHPVWFATLSPLVILAATWLGAHLGRRAHSRKAASIRAPN
jgi:hypothetical protein